MDDTKRLVIVGAGEMGEIAYEYFTHDSPYEVVAFSAEREHIKTDTLYDLPVIPLDDPTSHCPPDEVEVFVAITYTNFNRARARVLSEMKERGYTIASYVSSRAFVWHNVTLGENCFIFEHNVLQHNVDVGDNVIMWSGNHVGHRTRIHDHCFISSHVVISGYCEIGAYTFMGVNSTVRDYVKIAADCVVGAAAVIAKDTEPGNVYVGNPARQTGRSSYETLGLPEAERPA